MPPERAVHYRAVRRRSCRVRDVGRAVRDRVLSRIGLIRLVVAALLALSLLVANANAWAPGDLGDADPRPVRAQPLPQPKKVVVIVLENKRPRMIFGNPAAPTLNALARRYATLTHYDAIAHPSLPNYIALVSGSTHGIESNCIRCSIAARNL